jgi:hypothetical protein
LSNPPPKTRSSTGLALDGEPTLHAIDQLRDRTLSTALVEQVVGEGRRTPEGANLLVVSH